MGASCSFGTCSGGNSGAGAAGGGGAGGGTGGGSNANTVTDWASWCRLSQAAAAGFFGRCGYYTAQGAMESQQRDTQYCLAHPPSGLAAGRSRLDLAAAQACLTDFNGRTCAQGLPSGCEALTTGLVAPNGSCFEDGNECDTASWCDTSTTCPGRCVPRIAVGQPATPNARCVPNAYVANGVCTSLVAMGQSCAPPAGSAVQRLCLEGTCKNNICGPKELSLAAGATCAPNTSPECSWGLDCVAGTCQPLVDVNGACDSTRRCKADLQCSPANVCVRYGVVGSTCGPDLSCARNLYCNRPQGSTMGVCAALKPVNGPCAFDYECDIDTMFCTATMSTPMGVCQLKGAVATPCAYETRFGACQDNLYCTATMAAPTGVCANAKAMGATCTGNAECLSRNCTTGRCALPSACYGTP